MSPFLLGLFNIVLGIHMLAVGRGSRMPAVRKARFLLSVNAFVPDRTSAAELALKINLRASELSARARWKTWALPCGAVVAGALHSAIPIVFRMMDGDASGGVGDDAGETFVMLTNLVLSTVLFAGLLLVLSGAADELAEAAAVITVFTAMTRVGDAWKLGVPFLNLTNSSNLIAWSKLRKYLQATSTDSVAAARVVVNYLAAVTLALVLVLAARRFLVDATITELDAVVMYDCLVLSVLLSVTLLSMANINDTTDSSKQLIAKTMFKIQEMAVKARRAMSMQESQARKHVARRGSEDGEDW